MLTDRQIFHFCLTLINATLFPQGGGCQDFGLVAGDKCNLVDNYQGFRRNCCLHCQEGAQKMEVAGFAEKGLTINLHDVCPRKP